MPFLLERLAMCSSNESGHEFDPFLAIQAQLQRIFSCRNLRASECSAVLDWGLPNISELGSNDSQALERYAEQARQAILRNEPRLHHPLVTIEPQENVLTPFILRITAKLTESQQGYCFAVSLTR